MRRFFLVLMMLCALVANAQVAKQLYIIGGATPGGWDNTQSLKMSPVKGQDNVFVWTGSLKSGDFKFTTSLNTYMPAYNATTENEAVELGKKHAIKYNNEDEKDFKFVLKEDGYYTVTVNLNDLNMTITTASGKPDNPKVELWAVGTAVPGGVAKLTANGNDFSYAGKLLKGSVKLANKETLDDNTIYYVSSEEDIDIQDASGLVETNDVKAAGWNVEVPYDDYRINVNVMSGSISTELYHAPSYLYMVGGATTAGWNAGSSIPFVQDATNPNVFTFIGELRVREGIEEGNAFKILGQLDWGPYSLHPTSANASILGSTTFVVNGDDNKWTISKDKQGVYKIVVDLANQTLNAEYLGDFALPLTGLYLIGDATEKGWALNGLIPLTVAIPFSRDADKPYVYTFEGILKKGNVGTNDFKILGQPAWAPFSLHPLTENEPIIGSTKFAVNPNEDYKWTIKEDQQGLYRIVVNLKDGTIKAEFLGDANASLGTESKFLGGETAGINSKQANGVTISSAGEAVMVSADDDILHAELYNLAGTTVDSKKGGRSVILGKNLQEGVYVVSVTTKGGRITQKLLKAAAY